MNRNLLLTLVFLELLVGCTGRAATKELAAERFESERVNIFYLDDSLNESLLVVSKHIVRGDYLNQLQVILRNIASRPLAIVTEPQWLDTRGTVLVTQYSQLQHHTLASGQSVQLVYKAFEENAFAVRLKVDCQVNDCFVEEE